VVVYIGVGHPAPAKTSRPMTLPMLIRFAPPTRTQRSSWPLSPPRPPRVQRTLAGRPRHSWNARLRRKASALPSFQRRQPDKHDAGMPHRRPSWSPDRRPSRGPMASSIGRRNTDGTWPPLRSGPRGERVFGAVAASPRSADGAAHRAARRRGDAFAADVRAEQPVRCAPCQPARSRPVLGDV
jgi:hypothetical protein